MSCVSPHVKRERSDAKDGEYSQRASRPRKEQGEMRSMGDIISYDLRSSNVAVLEEAMKLLREEFNNKSDRKLAAKQDEFYGAGGHAVVVRVMLDHPNCKELQTCGLRIFMSATHRNTSVRNAIAKVNGILAIVVAMKQYNTHQDVIFFGLKALESLCHLDSNAEILTHRLAAIPLLIETMKRFSEDPDIVKMACDVFYQLAYNKKLRKPLLAAKAASALAAAFETHTGNQYVQEAALDALNGLTGA